MDLKKDYLLIALILILVCYVGYWAGYSNYKYSTFREGLFDIGIENYVFYYHLAWPGSVGGLQFISFAEHVDPFEVLLLPLYALYKNPLTLLVLQDSALAAAALVAYFIGKDLLKNRYLGFAIAIAFLINPGVRGINIYDFHPEAFIPLFYILCFYFYLNHKDKLFVVSYVLLLSIIETAVIVGVSLLVGLMAYELFESQIKKKAGEMKSKLQLLAICLVITVFFFGFYSLAISNLNASYVNNYKSMPPYFKIADFYRSQFKTILSPPSASYNMPVLFFVIAAIVGLIVLIFGFGTYAIRVPLTLLILISPWLFEVFVLHNPTFVTFYYEYFAYAIGGAVVAAFLGVREFQNKHGVKSIKVFNIVLIAVLISGYSLFYITLNNANNPIAWLEHNVTSTDVNYAISALNVNSSVMAQQSIAAHMYQFKNLETTPNIRLYAFTQNGFMATNVSYYWFRPEYIILDKNLSDYSTMNDSAFDVYNYMAQNYSLYYSSNGVEIYKQN